MKFKAMFLGKGLVVLAAIAAMGGMVMLLWNAVVPTLFDGARMIDYLHAVGLLVLSRILLGGFRPHGGWHERHHWNKWEAMTPEERAQFGQGWRAHRGWGAKE